MFTFDDLKVTSRDDRLTDRQNDNQVPSSRPHTRAARPMTDKMNIIIRMITCILIVGQFTIKN